MNASYPTSSTAVSPSSLDIGIVTPTISRAGGGIFPIVLAHARELSLLGHNVTVHGVNDDTEQLDSKRWEGLSLRAYKTGPAGFSRLLYADLLAGDYDLIHQHGLWMFTSIAVSGWRARKGRPVVISVQGMLEPWALSNAAWKKKLAGALFEKHNVRSASAVHCSAAEVAGVHAYAPTVPVAAIPNGVELPDLSIIHPAPIDLNPHERRILLFFGRLHPKKGIAELIRGWASLKQYQPDVASAWKVVIAGWDDGGHSESYKALARELCLNEADISFVGPRFGAQKAALFSHSDVFVLPSYSEGFPMAVLEAWSYGLPVLMTRECNIPEGFSAGAAIEIVNSPSTLHSQLSDALTRTDLNEIGRIGRKLTESSFSWAKVGGDLSALYKYVVENGQRPDFFA